MPGASSMMFHHIALMQNYLNNGELDALSDYLNQYGKSLPDDTLIQFCENTATNAVLLHFAQQAKNSGIDYDVKTDIPKDIRVSETDICIVLGNLLENAVDACRAEDSVDKKITVRANTAGGSLCITVDNTYTGTAPCTTRTTPAFFPRSTGGTDWEQNPLKISPPSMAVSAGLRPAAACFTLPSCVPSAAKAKSRGRRKTAGNHTTGSRQQAAGSGGWVSRSGVSRKVFGRPEKPASRRRPCS